MDVMRAGILPIPTVDGPTALDMHGKAAAKAANVIMTVRLRAIRGEGQQEFSDGKVTLSHDSIYTTVDIRTPHR